MKISRGTCIIEQQLKIKPVLKANDLIYDMIFEKLFMALCLFSIRMY